MADKSAHNEIRRGAAHSREKLIERFDSLSPREREVLYLLLQGLLNKEIAHWMQLSRRTVEDYRASLKRKMRARTSAELVTLVAKVDRHKSGN